jgi:hypothetical protein
VLVGLDLEDKTKGMKRGHFGMKRSQLRLLEQDSIDGYLFLTVLEAESPRSSKNPVELASAEDCLPNLYMASFLLCVCVCVRERERERTPWCLFLFS